MDGIAFVATVDDAEQFRLARQELLEPDAFGRVQRAQGAGTDHLLELPPHPIELFFERGVGFVHTYRIGLIACP